MSDAAACMHWEEGRMSTRLPIGDDNMDLPNARELLTAELRWLLACVVTWQKQESSCSHSEEWFYYYYYDYYFNV
ncbi:hypothetical protein I7I53_11797 [Histoplasma capsulatum var. duboisii H88]|uniref:Uncharacterized protein n=1 Tax=Ajellomyces capsulatus (strain H88) TaxID=544711 RepID=A0A8A1LZI0_AJEC8|nr:hypothetical protein I7I53_11797 [Histoplasma capsulatum var. duboisii H88]